MKKQEVYAEIVSYGIASHIVKFDSLKEARKSLEEHIEFMQRVGNYEIFRNEVADDIDMQENDMSITIYVPSGNDDIPDNDVEFVIIRPKKGETK
jgi:hypothetical protein